MGTIRNKKFPCGHRGRGQYCHACKAAEDRHRREQVAREAHRQAFVADAVDLRGFPAQVVARAREILAAVAGGTSYLTFKGHRMQYDRTVISVPVGHHHRLLFRETRHGLEPVRLLSHETYNHQGKLVSEAG